MRILKVQIKWETYAADFATTVDVARQNDQLPDILTLTGNQRNEFIAKGGGGAQQNISKEKIVGTIIPLPPLPLQQQFASKIEAIEKQKELIKKSIEDVEMLFNSRMEYYFN